MYKYDGKSVTFWYKDDKGVKHFVTIEVHVFIGALIRHIPDRNFKMIRYYGAYSRKTKKIYSGYLQRSITQTTFDNYIKNPNKWAPNCPKCGNKMIFDRYETGLPKKMKRLETNYQIGATQCLAIATINLHPKGAFLLKADFYKLAISINY